MTIFWIIIAVLAGYFFLVFFVLRLIAPFMGFGGYRPPTDLPEEMRRKINELENQSTDQSSYLKAAFDFVLSRWFATRGKAVAELPKLFRKDLYQLWNDPGYAHCTTQNFILYTLLANSRYFKAQDVQVKHTFLNFVPHQYLRVRVGEERVDVDPAAVCAGITVFGKYGRFIG